MRVINLLKSALIATLSASMLTACDSGSSDSPSKGTGASALSITGAFSNINPFSLELKGGYSPMTATEYTMVCAMLVSPFTSDAKALGSDGSFSLSIAGASGQPIGCFLTKDGTIAAVFEFENASSEAGSALAVNTGATTLEFPTTLSLNSDGTVTVSVADITQNSDTESSVAWADPTGTWTINKACMLGLNNSTGKVSSQCQAPDGNEIPTSVYMKTVTATDGTNTKTGLSIWKSLQARTDCGGVEGEVDLPNGFSATGGWDSAFSGGATVNLSTTVHVNNAATFAYAQSWNGSTFCDSSTTVTEGTTKCSDLDFGTGGWGMSPEACKLYCVMSAINNRELSNGSSSFDWAGYKGSAVACEKRYRMNWSLQNQLQNDMDFDHTNGLQAGALADGICDDSGDGCYDTINSTANTAVLEPDDQGPKDRFMFGVFNVTANVGTLIQKDNTGKHNFQNAAQNGSISCGGTRIEKFTMVQTSATKAQVTVEHSFIPDGDNNSECETNEDFSRMSDDSKGFVLQVTKQ